MTEQEAKALASELEYHPRYRVVSVYEVSPQRWLVDIEQRDNPSYGGTIYAPYPARMLRGLLANDDPDDTSWFFGN